MASPEVKDMVNIGAGLTEILGTGRAVRQSVILRPTPTDDFNA